MCAKHTATYQAASGLRKRFDMKRILSEYKDLLAKFKGEFATKPHDSGTSDSHDGSQTSTEDGSGIEEQDRAFLDFMYNPMSLA